MRRSRRPEWSVLIALLACSFWSAPVQAEVLDLDWISYAPPPECPSSEHIHARLLEWLGPGFSTDKLHVQAEVEWEEQAWRVTVTLNVDGVEGSRAVAVNSCTEAADFIALSTALAIDSDFQSPKNGDQRESPIQVEPLVQLESENQHDVGMSANVLPASTAAPPSSQAVQARSGDSLVQSTAWSSQRRWFGSAELLGVTGILPRFALGGGAHLGMEFPWVRFFSEFFVYPPVAVSNAGTSARLWLAGGGLGACGVFSGDMITVGPCLSGEWGSFAGSNSQASGSGLFAAIVPGFFVSTGSSRVSGVLRSDLVLPYLSPKFELSGGTLLHEAAVGVRFQLGVEYFLMD